MAYHRSPSEAFFILWCLLGSSFGIPSTSSYPRRLEERSTTIRPARVHVEIARTTMPLAVNSKIRMTTTTTTTPVPPAPTATMKTTSTTRTVATERRPISSEDPLYRLNGSNGQACILLQVDALITVKYRNKLGEDQEAAIYVPDDATVTGNCDSDNSVTMSLKWGTFVLTWNFAKSPGGERWYVEKIELTYNSSDKHFEHIDQPKKTIRLSTGNKHRPTLFPTPVGKSYACSVEVTIPLTDGKNQASVILREMKLQPFKFKNNEFAEEFSCNSLSARVGRDETAPVAVGSTLAVAVLLTISGYAVYRYFKVKKVKYDTME